MSRRGRAALALLLVLPALAACGGDDYPDEPQEVAERYVKSNDGSKCDYVTQAVMEQQTGKRGAAARKACRENVERFPAPEKVTIKEYEVEPDDAEVEFVTDGKEAKVELHKIDGRWRITGFRE